MKVTDPSIVSMFLEFNNREYKEQEAKDKLLMLHRACCESEIEYPRGIISPKPRKRSREDFELQTSTEETVYGSDCEDKINCLSFSDSDDYSPEEYNSDTDDSTHLMRPSKALRREGITRVQKKKICNSTFYQPPKKNHVRKKKKRNMPPSHCFPFLNSSVNYSDLPPFVLGMSCITSPVRSEMDFPESMSLKQHRRIAKCRKRRTVTTEEERDYLERMYTANPYPSREQYDEIRKHLNWKSSKRVTKWFNNKRYNTKVRLVTSV
mmetsp:Transcript_14962/g.16637  ORF Transcript_14962/g.16637 Transcript_14962/m.16637 type:complete len:265 (-) Transcript_14962:122-916(-)